MQIITKILRSTRLTARLSYHATNRKWSYASLVQILPISYENIEGNGAFINNNYYTASNRNKKISNFAIKVTGTSYNSYRSYKVLLIPLKWGNINESCRKNGIISIFLIPKKFKKIQQLSQNILTQKNTKQTKQLKSESEGITTTRKDLELSLKNSNTVTQSATYTFKNQSTNLNCLDLVAEVISKTANRILDIAAFHLHPFERDCSIIFTVKPVSVGLTHFTKIYSILKQREISRHKYMPFFETNGYITNSFPLIITEKYFSTRTTDWGESDLSKAKIRMKSDPNYDFPHLSKIFGADNLLMKSDAYNQALIEADKRRADLKDGKAASKKLKNFVVSRPQVINIKGNTIPEIISSNPCPPPVKQMRQYQFELESLNGKEQIKTIEMPRNCNDPNIIIGNKLDHKLYSNTDKTENFGESENTSTKEKSSYLNEHKECKPKCNEDPCKHINPSEDAIKSSDRKNTHCGKKEGESDDIKLKSDICKRDKNKQGATKLYSKKGNPCNRKDYLLKKVSRQTDNCKTKNPKQKVSFKENKQNEDPCKKMQSHGGRKQERDPCKTEKEDLSKKNNPCGDKKRNRREDPCKKKESYGSSKQTEDPCKKQQDPSKKKSPCTDSKPKNDPCKRDEQKENPCRKKESFGSSKQKEDASKKVVQKEDPCEKGDALGSSKQKKDPCKKQQEDSSMKKNPCEDSKPKNDICKKDEEKEDPCRKKQSFRSSKQKEEVQKADPCKTGDALGSSKQKEDPCKEQQEDSSMEKNPSADSKPKNDLCKKYEQNEDPCKKAKTFGNSKQNEDQCKKNPCGSIQNQDPCKDKISVKTKESDHCKITNTDNRERNPEINADIKNKLLKSSSCGTWKRETKPNCEQNKKCFSTLAKTLCQTSCNMFKRNFMTLPSLRINNIYNFAAMRHSSSKHDGKNKKKLDNLARGSQCKAVGITVPPHRKPAYNPHPREGLRHCYPTYDMDCKKLCKNARETSCKKLAFLKDTDDNKRENKK